jgi:hypothetical protein
MQFSINKSKSKAPPVTQRDRWATRKFKPVSKAVPPAQAALQISDDQRFSVKTRKAFGWLLVRVARFVQIIRDNTFLTILGAVSTLAFVITVLI